MYKLFLFDFDGTLIDSDPMIEQVFKILYQKYKSQETISKAKLLTFSGPPIRETLAKEFPLVNQEDIFNEFLTLSNKYNATHVKPYPGVVEFLEYIKEKNISTALITSKGKKPTMQLLEILNLKHYLDFVVTSDDVKNCKPNPEGILLAMDYFKVLNKSDVIYIGDSEFDYLVSKNAGVDFGYVLYSPREIEKGAKINVKIKSFKDYLNELKNEKD